MNDSISRQAAIDAVLNMKIEHRVSWKDAVVDTLDALPPEQPEREKGRWEMKPDPYGFFEEIPVCSECGCTTEMRKTYKYCPNCGADMRGEQE